MSEPLTFASAARAIDGAISRLVHDLVTPALPPTEQRSAAIDCYRAAREQTVSIIRDLTETQANFKPAPDVWSVSQVVEHLLLTEDLYRTQFQNMIAMAKRGEGTNIDLSFREINTSVAYIPREVMPMLTVPLNIFNVFVPRAVREAMFRIPLIPAVAPSISSPAVSQPIAELRHRAISSIAATEAVFLGNVPSNLDKMTLSHPILGSNNITQIFGIITAHEERHHGQMRTVIGNPRFPS
jgi:hypothetical protein